MEQLNQWNMAAQTAGQQCYDLYTRLTMLPDEVYHNMNVSRDMRRANEQATELSNMLYEFSVAAETYQDNTYTVVNFKPAVECLSDSACRALGGIIAKF